MSSASPESSPWQSGLRGARANLWPGLALQLVALAVVASFYWLPAVHAALARLVVFREETGAAFAIVSTALVGGLLPFLYLRRTGRYNGWQGLGLTVFWGYKGFEVDLLYHLQAHLVGSGHNFGTIAVKVCIDQLVYGPLLAAPDMTAGYQLVEAHFDWSAVWADWKRPHWYRRRVLPVLISNLGVWVPAVAIIYLLPTPLQLPLQNIVLCFYTLVIAHQTRTAPESTVLAARPA